MKFHSIAFAIALAIGTSAAQAGSLSYDGTLIGAPLFNRPVDAGPTQAPVGLANFGIDMPYSAFAFSVSQTGLYTFSSTAIEGWDNYTFLYGPSFNPAASLANVVVGNDDAPSVGSSGFGHALDAGATYVFVTTVFDGDPDQSFWGAFQNSITGPGSVVAVPEPESYALMGLGLAVLAIVRRRRR